MTITKRRATTSFDIPKLTLLEVLTIDNGVPADYGPEHFFAMFNPAMTVNSALTGVSSENSIQFLNTFEIWSQLDTEAHTPGRNRTTTLYMLRQLMTVPVGYLNHIGFSESPIPADHGTTASLAMARYRVLPILILV
jgi:hypothetical protein